jgi:glucose-6-phosphate 1-dehydrogenase
MTLTAMEPPARFDAEAIRNEKVKVLRSIAPLNAEDVVFGQYAPGLLGDTPVRGYLQEDDVAPDSRTETFVALRMWVSNWRWEGVPFYLRTGKRLPRQVSRIAISFRCPPVSLFQPFHTCAVSANQLVISVQPDEGFDLHFEVKAPGEEVRVRTERMRFRYGEAFAALPEAYETLLFDVLTGDPTLFVRADEVERSWEVYEPILDRADRRVHPYNSGSWGPEAADQLPGADGFRWSLR